METFFWLCVAHAVSDYSLQSDFIAKAKNRHTDVGNQMWGWVLLSHSLVHGGAVALATGVVALGVLETVAHFLIDAAKCEGFTSIHTDQWLHVACKAAWALMLMA